MYGKINKPFWDDKPVAVIGGGPSLIDFDFEKLRGAHVLAVKGSILDIPWADAGFGLGNYDDWRERLAHLPGRIYWALPEDQLQPSPSKNITFLKRLDGPQLSDDPSVIYGDGNADFASLQVCIHKRAKQIVLFGFDCDGSATELTGVGQETRRAQIAANWERRAEHFSIYSPYFSKHGIHVVNACPTSAIRCFQKVALQDAVAICSKGP